jgi:hypothetical protein
MKVSQKIEKQISQIPEGRIFGYQDMVLEADEYGAAAKSLGRLVATGQLKRATKGVYYKPKESVFGTLPPREDDLLKRYLFENGQRVAYITGVGLYNQMGLTTQVPFIVTIASKTRRTFASIGTLKIKPVKSYADITNDNYYLLGLLDAIKDFNSIPDRDNYAVIKILSNRIKELSIEDTNKLLKFALQYPPRVRALLGAIVEKLGKTLELDTLRKSLNPLSKYNYAIKKGTGLSNLVNWNLK